MATSIFDLHAVDQILSIVQGMASTLDSQRATLDQLMSTQSAQASILGQLFEKETSMAQVLVDLQMQQSRIADELRRAADMIAELQAGHTVADADVQAVTDALRMAADAFDQAVPPPAPAPQPGP